MSIDKENSKTRVSKTPSIYGKKWDPQSDNKLIKLVNKHGQVWETISKEFACRSSSSVRCRWTLLKKNNKLHDDSSTDTDDDIDDSLDEDDTADEDDTTNTQDQNNNKCKALINSTTTKKESSQSSKISSPPPKSPQSTSALPQSPIPKSRFQLQKQLQQQQQQQQIIQSLQSSKSQSSQTKQQNSPLPQPSHPSTYVPNVSSPNIKLNNQTQTQMIEIKYLQGSQHELSQHILQLQSQLYLLDYEYNYKRQLIQNQLIQNYNSLQMVNTNLNNYSTLAALPSSSSSSPSTPTLTPTSP